MRFFLLGFMGTGKSHWGRRWAGLHGLSFYDTDKLIEEMNGMSVTDIFEKKGEDFFRQQEAEVLRSMSKHSSCIVACGGGAPCFSENMEWMNANGITVFLSAPPRYLLDNIEKEKGKRPLLKNMNDGEILFFIEQKLKERMPFYSQAALTVQANELSDESFSSIIQPSTNDHA